MAEEIDNKLKCLVARPQSEMMKADKGQERVGN
jgi:hypothetical protein